MSDAEIKEAAAAVLQSTGTSSYLHGLEYPVDKFKKELDASIRYIKNQSRAAAKR